MKKIIGIIMTICLISVNMISVYASSIDLGVKNIPKLDIMLAIDNKAIKNTPISKDIIELDIENNLNTLSINTEDTSIVTSEASEIRAEQANFGQIVDSWTKVGGNKVSDTLGGGWTAKTRTINGVQKGTIEFEIINGQSNWLIGKGVNNDNNKNNRQYNLNYNFNDIKNIWNTNSDWRSLIYNPEGFDIDKFNCSFKAEADNNLNNGFIFNITPGTQPDRFNGYCFSLCYHSGYYDYSKPSQTGYSGYSMGTNGKYGKGIYTMSLYRLEDVDFDFGWVYYGKTGSAASYWCYGNENKTEAYGGKWIVLKTYTIDRNPGYYNTYELTVDKNKMKLTCRDTNSTNTLFDLEDTSPNAYMEGTYGFWGNNCERQSSMKITDFIMECERKKTFSDILLNNKWRDNSIRNVTNIQNKVDNTLLDNAVITNTLNNNINFIQWGSVENKGVIDKFLNAIEQNGTNFYYKKEDLLGN